MSACEKKVQAAMTLTNTRRTRASEKVISACFQVRACETVVPSFREAKGDGLTATGTAAECFDTARAVAMDGPSHMFS